MANNGRGKSPGSRKALEENRYCLTTETAQKASEKAVEARREYKTLREIAKEMFDEERKAGWLAAMAEKADGGDAKAFEILRDTMGEKPSDSMEISGNVTPFSVNIRVVD